MPCYSSAGAQAYKENWPLALVHKGQIAPLFVTKRWGGMTMCLKVALAAGGQQKKILKKVSF
jgi:hypothetical protein